MYKERHLPHDASSNPFLQSFVKSQRFLFGMQVPSPHDICPEGQLKNKGSLKRSVRKNDPNYTVFHKKKGVLMAILVDIRTCGNQ